MSESPADLPDVEVPDVDVPDVDTPTPDDQGDAGDLTDAQIDEALQLAHEDEVEYGPDGSLRFRDGVDPLEVYQRAGAPVNTGVDEDDGSFERWYQKQVASYGQPKGAGAGTGRSRRRGLFGSRATNSPGSGVGFRLGALINLNVKFGGGARTTNVTGLSVGGGRPGTGARIASRSRKAR